MKTVKQIREENLDEGWLQGQPKTGHWIGKIVKHDGANIVKVKSEHPEHVVVTNGLSEYPIKKSDVNSFHRKDHLSLVHTNESVIVEADVTNSHTDYASWKKEATEMGAKTFKRHKYMKHVEVATHKDGHHVIGQWDHDDDMGHTFHYSHLHEDVLVEKQRKKFLGTIRGTTATGQKANPIDVEPTLKLKGKTLAHIRKGGQ